MATRHLLFQAAAKYPRHGMKLHSSAVEMFGRCDDDGDYDDEDDRT